MKLRKFLLTVLTLALLISASACNFDTELSFGDPEVPTSNIDKPTEKPIGDPTEQPTEEPTEEPSEKPTEKPTEKPADSPEDNVDPSDPPEDQTPPTDYTHTTLQGARFENEVKIHDGTLIIPEVAPYGGGVLAASEISKVDFSFMSSKVPQYLTKESFEEIYGKIENDSSISQVDKMTFSNFFKLYDLDMLDSFPAEQKDSFAKAWSEKYPIIDKTPVYVFSGTTDVEADMVDKLFNKVGVSLEDRAAHIDSLKGYCTEPDEIIFGNNMVYPLDASEVSNVEIPEGIESIRLSGMKNVKEITLPESVKSIEKMAFAYSTSLEKIYIPAGVSSISADAFYECPALAEITFGGTEAQWAQLAASLKLNETCTVICLGDAQ